MADKKHRCGGTLRPRNVTIRDERGRLVLAYVVSGSVCDNCGEELVDRATMAVIQASQIPAISFLPEGVVPETSAVDMKLRLIPDSSLVAV